MLSSMHTYEVSREKTGKTLAFYFFAVLKLYILLFVGGCLRRARNILQDEGIRYLAKTIKMFRCVAEA